MFVLGVEWGTFRHQLRTGIRFEQEVHADNVERLQRLTQRNGREAVVTARSEQFATLTVDFL